MKADMQYMFYYIPKSIYNKHFNRDCQSQTLYMDNVLTAKPKQVCPFPKLTSEIQEATPLIACNN